MYRPDGQELYWRRHFGIVGLDVCKKKVGEKGSLENIADLMHSLKVSARVNFFLAWPRFLSALQIYVMSQTQVGETHEQDS